MATATSSRRERRVRRAGWPAAALLVALLTAAAVAVLQHSPAQATPAAFSWLESGGSPPGWHVASTPSGATFAYPNGWKPIRTDAGTASVAPAGRRGAFRGYLNATPQGGPETLANWARFRPAHVADEGAHAVRLDASATGLRFRNGRGSCVIDSYSTDTTRFREIACIVSGRRATTVMVAAAPVARWAQQAPALERAVASFAT